MNPQTALIILHDMLFFAGKEKFAFCKEAVDLLTHEIFPAMSEIYIDCYCLSCGVKRDRE